MGPRGAVRAEMGPERPSEVGWDPTLLQKVGPGCARLGARAFSGLFEKRSWKSENAMGNRRLGAAWAGTGSSVAKAGRRGSTREAGAADDPNPTSVI